MAEFLLDQPVADIWEGRYGKKMLTNRAALNWLLDETDSSLTLTTLASAARGPARRIRF